MTRREQEVRARNLRGYAILRGAAEPVKPLIQWDKAKLKRFRLAIAVAAAKGTDPFTFDGHEFVLAYARYLVIYLEQVFAQKGGTE